MDLETQWCRKIAWIGGLVEKAPGQTLGRTAIVKLGYFLQVLRHVPLGYDFRLYTYGPFESDVLQDLSNAQVLGAVTEKTVLRPTSYSYNVRPGKRWAKVQEQARDWLNKYQNDIDEVIREFGNQTASDLELLSTIIFVDRENAKQGKAVSLQELSGQVRHVKPRFSPRYGLAKCQEAFGKGFLRSISAS